MEKKPDEIKGETVGSFSGTSETTAIAKELELGLSIVPDDTLLIRMVPEKFIRPNNTITSDAYRPKKKEGTETGLEKNVSTAPKTCYDTTEKLEKYNNRRKHRLFEMKAQHPNEREYPCIQDKPCHIGITGDMSVLFKDEESLEHFANNSKLLYPIP